MKGGRALHASKGWWAMRRGQRRTRVLKNGEKKRISSRYRTCSTRLENHKTEEILNDILSVRPNID